jgi:hypothetical protein
MQVWSFSAPSADDSCDSEQHDRKEHHWAPLCRERWQLTQNFMRAIAEVAELYSQQKQAIIDGDPDYSRFDVLIHLAAEKKDNAKYALLAHIETHGCSED